MHVCISCLHLRGADRGICVVSAAIMYQVPKAILKDGVLTSALPHSLPVMDRPMPEFWMHLIRKKLAEGKDKDVLTNAELDIKGLNEDKLGMRCLKLSQLEPLARNVARVFHNLGVARGDVVHLAIPNTTMYMPLVFGLWMCRAIVSAIDPTLKTHSFVMHFQDAPPKVVVCCVENRDEIKGALTNINMHDSVKLLALDDDTELRRMLASANDLPDPPTDEPFGADDTCALLWSSGTTARAKGIKRSCLSFAQFSDTASMAGFVGSKALLTTHFFHVSGFTVPLIALLTDFSVFFFTYKAMGTPEGIPMALKSIEKHQLRILFIGSNFVMTFCQMDKLPIAADTSCVQLVNPTGTAVPMNTFDRLKRHFPNLQSVLSIYFTTEFGGSMVYSLEPGRLGTVSPGASVKIVNPETDETCGPYEVGEIVGKCAVVTKGYFNRPEEDAKLFTEDGYMRTGDLGHYDDDNILYFDGRLKELLKYKSNHIYPTELEELIGKHPAVAEVAVFGKDDPIHLEVVTAAVVLKDAEKHPVTAAEIENLVADNLEDFKKLRGGVHFVDKLPRNPIGKVVRKELTKIFRPPATA